MNSDIVNGIFDALEYFFENTGSSENAMIAEWIHNIKINEHFDKGATALDISSLDNLDSSLYEIVVAATAARTKLQELKEKYGR
jgi:hypothetical protein